MSELVKIRYKVRSVNIRPGDEALVSEEMADHLTSNGHARRVFDVLDLEVDLGTIAGILAEVGDDKDKAQAALDAEQEKGDNARVTLVSKLQAVLDA